MTQKPTVFAREATGLTRNISGKDAVMLTISTMGLGYVFFYMYFGPGLYPGVNLLYADLIAIPISLLTSGVYYLLSVAMPRTGGDYVYNSRILHPALAFMSNFWYVIIITTFFGIGAGYVSSIGLSPMFWALGTATGNQGYISLGQTFASPNVVALISVLVVVLLTVILALGSKWAFRLTWVFFSVMLIGFLLYIATILAAGHDTIIQRFSQISGTTPDKVIAAAKTAGYNTDFTTSGITLGIVYSMLNFAGFTAASYYAGEVKQVKKTQVYALFGATIAFGLLLAVFFGVLYSVIGAPFLHSLDFLSISGNPAYTFPVPPEGQSLIIFATGNPIMLVLAPLILIVSFFAGTIASNFLASRMIFAWSFDRLTPTKLLDLDSRFGAPYWTYILIGAIGMISVFISVYTTLFNYLAYEATGFAIVYMVAGLAALVFPFRRKELFRGSPDIVKKRIGGVPLISILGLLTFVVSAIIAYATLTPAFQGGPLNFQNVLVVGAITVLGVVFYYVSYFYNKQRGIDLNLTFKEIPPE